MTKLKTIVALLGLVTATAYGLTSGSFQGESAQGAKNPTEKSTDSAKRAPPPAFTQTAEYVVEPPDLVDLRVDEALPGRPIFGERLVRADGKVSVGWYGDLYVAGLTVREIKKELIGLLQKFIHDEQLGLVVLDASGEAVVEPATGKPKQIDPKDSKKVRVEVTECSSKCFYVHGEVRSPGRFPFTGTERIIDAIETAGGLSSVADQEKVLLYRADSRGEPECLTVDVNQIRRGKLLSTNHALKPSDRVVVHRRAGAIASVKAEGDQPLNVRSDDRSLRQIEKRMTELEQKLDLILEAIKRRRS
jgi:polysaccharide export outer membrane protein